MARLIWIDRLKRAGRSAGVNTLTLACAGAVTLSACGEGSIGNPWGPSGPSAGLGFEQGDVSSDPGDPRTGSTGSASGPSGMGSTKSPTDPGHVVLRRLNRSEYNNTVADLLGTRLTPADEFPADDLGGEFTTVGSALSLSPIYVEQYEAAAHALVDELFDDAARLGDVVPCDLAALDASCAEQAVGDFAHRAFRRPVTDEERDSLIGPYRKAMELGAPARMGLKYSLAATLLSPHFLFKVELGAPSSSDPVRLSPHELATRLSYALWASMPDEELSRAAADGSLVEDATLRAQVTRMLDSSRADALLDTFAAEWIGWNRLEAHEVDAEEFPEYSEELALAMKEEARRYFGEFLREELPLSELLDAPFTYLDSTLAEHYGLPAPDAPGFSRVDTTATPRRGLLSLGALLTVTSFSTRTSPVKRGEFVSSRLLCLVILPPPEGVGALPEPEPGLTLRERMEAHRDNPSCSGCHSVMDPIGFGMENFDPVGVYRTEDGGDVIDASGMLPGGLSFSGPTQLGAAVTDDPRYMNCVASKFSTFAVGRLFDGPEDRAWMALLADRTLQQGGSLKSLIREVVLSELFRSAR